MEIFSALLAICEGNSLVTGEFPSQRPVTRSFDVFFDLCLNTRLSKQMGPRWFETLSCSLWRRCNEYDNGITGYIIRRISNFSVFIQFSFYFICAEWVRVWHNSNAWKGTQAQTCIICCNKNKRVMFRPEYIRKNSIFGWEWASR